MVSLTLSSSLSVSPVSTFPTAQRTLAPSELRATPRKSKPTLLQVLLHGLPTLNSQTWSQTTPLYQRVINPLTHRRPSNSLGCTLLLKLVKSHVPRPSFSRSTTISFQFVLSSSVTSLSWRVTTSTSMDLPSLTLALSSEEFQLPLSCTLTLRPLPSDSHPSTLPRESRLTLRFRSFFAVRTPRLRPSLLPSLARLRFNSSTSSRSFSTTASPKIT